MKIINYNKGFTFIELLIVIAIIGILSLITIPNLSNFRKEQALKNTTENVITLLDKAQSDSLSSLNSNNYGVHFASNYMVYFVGSTFSNTNPNNKKVDFEPGVAIPLNGGINLNGGGSNIIFPRLTGNVVGYGTIILQLTNKPTHQKIIKISKVGSVSL